MRSSMEMTIFVALIRHGGIFTPEYLAKHLHKNIQLRRNALELIKLPGHMKAKDGSTALVTLVTGSITPTENLKQKSGDLKVYCANTGDCRGGRAIRLSEDHKPNRGDEERRVRAAGGYVVNIGGVWRVTTAAGAGAGEHQYLAVSRTFGDTDLKQPNKIVVSEPEIKVLDITSEDCFIVMACDGIWDMLDDQEAVDIAGEHFGRPQDAAASVVRTAYQKGSGDNLTCTVIEFGWVGAERFQSLVEDYKKSLEQKEEDLDMFGD
ncbi:hypothetical protein GUITHDRAFT_105978 [Guillardia theta CCMP2712]|uniref:PPM-type phosphatase domain-containing protein n=1 Tax=Guillardia theta (strain CCMP2712) TaxID=905079 RepID=L1JJV9_GUITC|nr:hypothetical protein GUITHDRAFT_105978 [Guillardia theta CCMP2712]EKX48370.1 hypothetical protein GUITHDRAFT_105978 [Guillardia theta CCMP2712]|eukprot:XP_005835350.1 hypothetical protein GUITHDRAFT_105978 [Guillardia theta CCMP2712]